MALPSAEELRWARQRRAHLREAGSDLDIVLTLRKGTGPPLFCAPPLVGLSWCYLALSQHLRSGNPVVGLQSRGLRRPEPLPADMAELTRDLADHLRNVQPDGPYHLFGWSLGGNMAHAIAERLEHDGHEVALLVMGDATPALPYSFGRAADSAWRVCNFVLREVGYQPAIPPDEPEPEARMLALVRERPGLSFDAWPDERVLALPRVVQNNLAISQAHRPGRVSAPMLFLSATRGGPPTEKKVASWQPHTGGPVDVVDVDCRHEHLLLPQPVARIGAAISARLL
ncbi:alpha/beta fold hydrolase [Actinophytocola oryzae]|uniref:Thioesterase domain-containing protein n=1 Tax=Actinophytocola oryzae TaxID=502181 RepID=A0A4R7VJW5_9PSEU|nr:alpha/beta fold hydrolase [Actinophytocola oryzae]TDV49732.1 thioesterase domain-containing protein [Actinophytocola oryzae]